MKELTGREGVFCAAKPRKEVQFFMVGKSWWLGRGGWSQGLHSQEARANRHGAGLYNLQAVFFVSVGPMLTFEGSCVLCQ